jgi:hypothetical protein
MTVRRAGRSGHMITDSWFIFRMIAVALPMIRELLSMPFRKMFRR